MWGNPATYELDDPMDGLETCITPRYLRILHDLVSGLPYWEMEPANDVVAPGTSLVEGVGYRTNFCLAKSGQLYLVFSLNGGPLDLALAPGRSYHLTQVDPRTGRQTDLGKAEGGVHGITVPAPEQVLLVR